MEIMTCDNEWSYEELYGVAYDECMKACEDLDYLLDMKDLNKPNILMETIVDGLDSGLDFVDYYNEFYTNKSEDESSDDIFEKWDQWIIDRIKSTLEAHRYKHYTYSTIKTR